MGKTFGCRGNICVVSNDGDPGKCLNCAQIPHGTRLFELIPEHHRHGIFYDDQGYELPQTIIFAVK
jgi:hypothetical protein